MRTFTDEKTGKFWDIDLQGDSFTVTSGRVGTKGRTRTRTFADPGEARREHDRLVSEKLAEGFVETTPPALPAAPRGRGVRQALEDALAANPDDMAAHMAYADRLQEEGDPRGEFIGVQLALEQPGRPADERNHLRRREESLLREHGQAWLGAAVGCLSRLDSTYPAPDWLRAAGGQFHFARGWLRDLTVTSLTTARAEALAACPGLRLLRRLEIQRVPDGPVGFAALARSPYLANVRVFQSGCDYALNHWGGAGVHHLFAGLPGLEELLLLATGVDTAAVFGHPCLTRLRRLEVCHQDDYALFTLAGNPDLGRLTHLVLQPLARSPEEGAAIRLDDVQALVRSPHLHGLTHLTICNSDMGDAGCRAIVSSGILGRLEVLDLTHGAITDEGALALAACPDLRRLERIVLDNNRLTAAGIETLQACGVAVQADAQQTAGEQGYAADYLMEGEWE